MRLSSGGSELVFELISQPTAGFYNTWVVFIHGLGGDSRDTWTKDGNPDLFWLQWLGQWLPHSYVWTFGYNARKGLRPSNSAAGIRQFAIQLLNCLHTKRGDNVSVLFVAHSMGGLVVKKAFNLSRKNPQFFGYIGPTDGIIFMGTPHKGSIVANKAIWRLKVLRAALLTRDVEQYIEELRPNAPALREINQQFADYVKNLPYIGSCFETIKTHIPTVINDVIVPEHSAILNIPGEKIHAMDKNHHDLTRYSGSDDLDYQIILGWVVSHQREYGPLRPRLLKTPEEQDALARQLLGSHSQLSEDIDFLRNKQLPGSVDWILQNPNFEAWENPNTQKLRSLFLLGSSGTGKTILAASITDYIRKKAHERKPPLIYHSEFFDDAYQDDRSIVSLIKALAAGIYRDFPEFQKHLASLATMGYDLERDHPRSVWTRLFKVVLPDILRESKRSIYWIIDGLDGCPSAALFLELFNSTFSSSPPVPIKLLVLSSPSIDLGAVIHRNDTAIMSIDDNPGRLEAHQLFVKHLITTSEVKIDVSDVRKLSSAPQGNFLISELLFWIIGKDQLLKSTKPENYPTIQDLWRLVETAMSQQWSRVDRDMATKIMTFIMYCSISLDVHQLMDALRLLGLQLDGPNHLKRLCGPMVDIRKGRVKVSHRSVRQYLMRRRTDSSLLPEDSTAHETILQACLASLTQVETISAVDDDFIDYSVTYWPNNLLGAAKDLKRETLELLIGFLSGDWQLSWIRALAKRKQIFRLLSASKALKFFMLNLNSSILSNRHDTYSLLGSCVTDLIKIHGKYGELLTREPEAIYDVVPAFESTMPMIDRYLKRNKIQPHLSSVGIPGNDFPDLLGRLHSDDSAKTVYCCNQYVATISNCGEGIVKIFHKFSPFSVMTFKHHDYIQCAAFSHQGHIFATCSADSTKVWNVGDESNHLTFKYEKESIRNPFLSTQPTEVQAVEFTMDDSFLLCYTKPGRIWQFDPSAETSKYVELSQPATVSPKLNSACAAFSAGAERLVLAYDFHSMVSWTITPDLQLSSEQVHLDPSLTRTLGGRFKDIQWVSSTSPQIISTRGDGSAWIWDVEHARTSLISPIGVQYVKSGPTGSYLVTQERVGSVDYIKFWKTEDLSLFHHFSTGFETKGFSLSTDGYKICTLHTRFCNIWIPDCMVFFDSFAVLDGYRYGDSRDGYDTGLINRTGPIPRITKLEISPRTGSRYAYAVYRGLNISEGDGASLHIYDGQGNSLRSHHYDHSKIAYHMAWSEDERYVAILFDDESLWIFEISSSQESLNVAPPVTTFFQDAREVEQILFCNEGKSLLVAKKTSLSIWHFKDTSDINKDVVQECGLYWTRHPARSNVILGFGPNRFVARDISLPGLGQLVDLTITINRPPTLPDGMEENETKEGIFDGAGYRVRGTVISNDRSQVLVEIVQTTSQKKSIVFVSIGDIDDTLDGFSDQLNATMLPEGLANRVAVVIGFTSDKTVLKSSVSSLSTYLVFLDRECIICTINGNLDFKEHLQLPADWLDLDYLNMIRVTKEGVLFIPKDDCVVRWHGVFDRKMGSHSKS
ncbi:hypothetical protein BX600DRAFT_515123 [Xylariales sp. PMI_506]|nr:hypothetical protein BX600DRAFT_515123 [Xylariales sp. PMI_506]